MCGDVISALYPLFLMKSYCVKKNEKRKKSYCEQVTERNQKKPRKNEKKKAPSNQSKRKQNEINHKPDRTETDLLKHVEDGSA